MNTIRFPVLAATLALAGGVSAGVLLVDDDAPPGGDGLTWETAFGSVQDALAAARQPESGIDEIRVAQGRYLPDPDPFELVDGVALRGGYAGLGAPDPDARDPDAYPSILDGDVADDDGDDPDSCCSAHGAPGCSAAACQEQVCQELPSCCDTSWDLVCASIALSPASDQCVIAADCPEIDGNLPVVTATGTGLATVLEGFTVTHGRRGLFLDSGSATIEDCAFSANTKSGMLVHGSGAAAAVSRCTFSENADSGLRVGVATATVTGCVFTGNATAGAGGGISAIGEVSVTGCALTGNQALSLGGGMSLGDGSVIDCTFSRNVAFDAGGGLYASESDSRVIGCAFEGNSAAHLGGGAFVRQNQPYDYPMAIISSLFAGNTAETGAGVAVWGDPAAIVNCTLTGNVASTTGGAVSGDYLEVVNSVLWNNAPDEIDASSPFIDVIYSDVQGGYPGAGNIDADPLLADPPSGDHRLSPGSPCIDAGHSQTLLTAFGGASVMKLLCDEPDLDGDGDTVELIPVDLDGMLRFFDDPATPDTGCAAGPVVDMGAYEFAAPTRGPRVIQADVDGDGEVGVTDLLRILADWGPCDDPCCVIDFGGVLPDDPCKFGLPFDGLVGLGELHTILALWGR